MWALVKTGIVSNIFHDPVSLKIRDNEIVTESPYINYPKNIFDIWSETELNAIGLYTVTYVSHPKKDFHDNGSPVYTFANNVVTMAWSNSTEKKVVDVKSVLLAKIKSQLYQKLYSTDWTVLREADTGKVIPIATKTIRDNYRTKEVTFTTAINSETTISGLESLIFDWEA
jgi:hypothetical protein